MRTLRRTLGLSIACCLRIAGPAAARAQARPAPIDTAAILARARPEIDAANAAWLPGLLHRQADSIAAAYSDSAVFVMAGGKSITGRAAIRDLYAARFPSLGSIVGGGVRQLGIVVVKPDRIYEWGEAWAELAPASASAAPTRHGGTYLTVWQRESDGHWRISHNISMP